VKHSRRVLRALLSAAALVCGAAGVASAQDGHFFYPPPQPGSMAITKDVAFAPGDTGKLRMDVYRPSAGEALPTLIFFNGTGLPRSSEMYAGWARIASFRGLVAIVPDLRPDSAAQDFQKLLAYLTAHAAEYKIDKAAIAMYAASANVPTAFPIAEDPHQTAIAAAVMYYGTAAITQFRRDVPVFYVRAGLDRPAVNGGGPGSILALAGLAISQNAPLTLVNDAGGHHAFEVTDDDGVTRQVIEETIQWVKAAVSRPYLDAVRHGAPEAEVAGQVAAGDAKAAVPGYAKLVNDHPDDVRLRLSYAEALLGDKQFETACAQFERLKGKGLGPRDVGLPAARACMQNGDAELALAWLRTIPRQFLPSDLQEDPMFASLRMRAEFRALFQPQ
jgi:acetyl esterase/lipase